MDQTVVLSFIYSEIIVNHGVPYEIISDRGLSFLAEEVQEFLQKYQILHLKTAPYHPQTNGMIERVHSTLNHSIRTLREGDTNRWDEVLEQDLFGLRIRKLAVTQKSPFELLYGVSVRLPVDIEFPDRLKVPLDPKEREEALADFNSYRLKQLGQDRAAAYFKSLSQAKKMERTRDIKYKYDIGHYAKLKNHQRTKFEPYWTGPYIVTELGFPGTYWLIKANGQRLDSLVNETNLAPWISQEELIVSNQERNEHSENMSNSNDSNSVTGLDNLELQVVDIPPEGDSDMETSAFHSTFPSP
jgi:hypothetical protein